MSKYFYTNVSKWGKEILVRGYRDGKPFKERVEYEPTLFIHTNEETEFKDLLGKPVKPIKFANIKEANSFLDKYDDVENMDVLGMDNFIYAYISDTFHGESVSYDRNLIKIGRLDIETEVTKVGKPDPKNAPEVINVITIESKDTYYVFSINDYVNPEPSRKLEFEKFNTEVEMLAAFVRFMESMEFDIITGWYSAGFDIPYLVNRIERILDVSWSNRLSPWKNIYKREFFDENGKLVFDYRLAGMTHIDYKHLYEKVGFSKQAFYSLDWVCTNEVGRGKFKKEDSGVPEYLLYKTDPQNHIEYNVQDVELLVLLDKKKRLFDLIIGMAYDAKCNYDDVLKNTRMWDAIIFNYLKVKKVVVPKRSRNPKIKYEGAYVKEVNPHFSEWVMSFDLTSLYPSLIMQYNISPETFVKKVEGFSLDDLVNLKDLPIIKELKENNWTMAANGMVYTKDFKGVVPQVIEIFFDRRKLHKDLMIQAAKDAQECLRQNDKAGYEKYSEIEIIENISQNARKVAINALYGALGESNFRYYSLDNAEATTISGKLTFLISEKWNNEYMNDILKTKNVDYILYGDTDSIYIDCSGFVKLLKDKRPDVDKETIINYLDKVGDDKLQEKFKDCFVALGSYLNVYQQRLSFKREKICEAMIQTAKKKYGLYVWDSEKVRYATPKVQITGLESVRTSTPHKIRSWMEDAVEYILTKDEAYLWDYIEDKKKLFYSMDCFDIGEPTSISDLEKYTDRQGFPIKGATENARGSALFNRLMLETGMSETYNLINSGEKIRKCKLKQPNPFGEKSIAFMFDFPDELGVKPYLDYDQQWEKVFIKPLERLLSIRGWNTEEVATLDGIFF